MGTEGRLLPGEHVIGTIWDHQLDMAHNVREPQTRATYLAEVEMRSRPDRTVMICFRNFTTSPMQPGTCAVGNAGTKDVKVSERTNSTNRVQQPLVSVVIPMRNERNSSRPASRVSTNRPGRRNCRKCLWWMAGRPMDLWRS